VKAPTQESIPVSERVSEDSLNFRKVLKHLESQWHEADDSDKAHGQDIRVPALCFLAITMMRFAVPDPKTAGHTALIFADSVGCFRTEFTAASTYLLVCMSNCQLKTVLTEGEVTFLQPSLFNMRYRR